MINHRKIENFAFILLTICISSCSRRHRPSPEQITAAVFKTASITSCKGWIGGCSWRDSTMVKDYARRIVKRLVKGGVAEGYSQALVGVSGEGYVELLYWTRRWNGKHRLNLFYEAREGIQPCSDLTEDRAKDLVRSLTANFDSSWAPNLGIFIDGESTPRAIPSNPSWQAVFGKLSECTNGESND
jgi:hypothetical protein